MMRKRVLGIAIQSSYDVLDVFLQEIYKGFETLGYDVEEFTIDDKHTFFDLIKKPFQLYEFVFSINSALLGELAFYLPATTPAVAYLVDHPIEHDARIRNACLTYLVAHVGRYRVQYADDYYKNINRNTFIPHGGSKSKLEIPYECRKYNVVLLGGYENIDKILARINGMEGHLPDFNLQLIKILVSDETISWGNAIKQVCSNNNIELTDLELMELGRKTFQADNFFRMYTRELLVKTLIEHEIYVDVFGKGWENIECDNMKYLRIHDPVSYKEALDIMADSKIVLNIAPTHNAGAHERIFSAMLNGAVCFTNYSSYLKETGLEELLVLYSIHDMDSVPEMVSLILNNPAAAKEIARRAEQCALKEHTWANRAKDIVNYVNDYKKEFRYEMVAYNNGGESQFWELCRFIRENKKELLFEKMKCCVHNFLEDSNGRMAGALNSYNRYGYWGGCLRREGDYELLENRATALKDHLEDFIWMYKKLTDEKSRDTLYAIMRHWIDYAPHHLRAVAQTTYDQYFDHDIVSCTKEEVFVDLGTYTGDTVSSYLKNYSEYKRIYCYDIDEGNLDIAKNNLRLFENIEYRQCAVGDKEGYIYVTEKSDSSANSIADTGERKIKMVSLDADILDPITFIKMDIEGSEQIALLGAKKHIINEHPKMAISIDHNNEDIWKIAKMIYEMDSNYHFYIRYYGGEMYPSEYVLYAI